MRKQHKPKGLKPIDFLQILPLSGRLALTLSAWCILPTHAETVYRCGDQYSANPSCNGAAIPSISDARNARQAQTQTMQTLQAQQQADALEKNRLKAEQQTQRNAAVMPTYNRDAMFSSTVDSAPPMPPSHGKHRKVASPYFTAKDNTPKSPQKKAEKNGASPKAAP